MGQGLGGRFMKIEYNGKEIINIDDVKEAVEKTEKQVSSDEVTKIVVCNEYPTVEENGVLYIKLES